MKNLKSDEKRQAVPTLKGYSYQIWLSVLQWLELEGNQYIFLEGAEDLDVFKADQAETIQVKATAAPITLRTKGVFDAINNFWEHQTKNPAIQIKFRYLTTSERTFESGDPFNGVKGLDFWDSCKFPGTDTTLLRDFLKNFKNLLPELKTFIDNSTEEELRKKLIIPIEWDTGNKSLEFIEELVENRVISCGGKVFNFPPHTSKSVIPHLLKHIWEVVCKDKDRFLNYPDLLKVFETSTMELVSKKDFQEFQRSANQMSNPFDLLNSNLLPNSLIHQTGINTFLENFKPPNLNHFAERNEVVNKIKRILNDNRTLVLVGSTGMGKSILSYQLAAATKGNWKKIDLRGCNAEQIKNRLLLAASYIESNSERIDCILDDLNFDEHFDIYENALSKLLFLLKIRNGRIVITSHHKLPIRIENLFDIKRETSFTVPRFNETEILNLLTKYECPSGHKLKYWSKVISLITQRHPLLCHTQVRKHAENKWKALPEEDILFKKDQDDIKQELVKTIRGQLSEDTRLLLYRLTIFTNRFKRKQALDIGKHDPKLRFPGEEFDKLIGPWIEPVGNDYFRLSPLLSRIQEDYFTEQEIKELHKTAAESFLGKTLGQVELDGLLWHGFLGEADHCLVAAVMCSTNIDAAQQKLAFQYIDWFYNINVENGKKLYKNSLLNYMLRRLQFSIAAKLNPEKAVKIAEITEQEIFDWDKTGSPPPVKQICQFMFLTDVIINTEVPFSIKQVFNWTTEFGEIIDSKNSFFLLSSELQNQFEQNFSAAISTPEFYIYPIVFRCKTGEDVIKLLDILDKANISKTLAMWKVFKKDNYISGSLIDEIWLKESEEKVPDWIAVSDKLDWIIQFSLKNDAVAVGVAGYVAKAIIHQEYLKDVEKASEILDQGEIDFSNSKLFIQDYRAKTFYLQKQYEKAFNIWVKVLPKIYTDKNITRGTSFRDAEICAANLNKWNKVAEFALLGEEASRLPWSNHIQYKEKIDNSLGDVIALSYRADYAFAVWKAGNKELAVTEFFNIVNKFRNLPNPKDDIKVNLLYRRVGHTIGWMNKSTWKRIYTNKEDGLFEPPVACFSNSQISDEITNTINDLLILPIINFKFLLARIEHHLQIGNTIFENFESELSSSTSPDINTGYLNLLIKRALTKVQLQDLVSQYFKYSSALKDSATSSGEHVVNWNDEEDLRNLIFAALIITCQEQKQNLIPTNEWKNDINSYYENSLLLSNWLDYLENGLNSNIVSLSNCLKNSKELAEKRNIAAAVLSSIKVLDVDTRFHANVFLLTTHYIQGWEEDTENYIEKMVVDGWINVVKLQRFYLHNPQVYAGRILNACNDDSSNGINKAAKILLEVNDATFITLDKETLSYLKHLSTD